MTLLMEIQSDVRRVANAISSAMGLEVTISDSEYNLVASSAGYYTFKGTTLSSTFKAGLFRMNRVVIVDNPGKHPLCKGCTWEGNCPEKAIILKPILYQGQVIGDIGLTSFTEEQRQRLLTRYDGLIEFLDQMAELLVVKITERAAHNELLVYMEQLKATMDFTDEGLLCLDNSGKITHYNKMVTKLFNKQKEELIGTPIEKVLPALPFDKIVNSKDELWDGELIFNHDKQRVHLLASGRLVRVQNKLEAVVISIRDMKQVQEFVYKIGVSNKKYDFDDIIGQSPSIQAIKQMAMEVANSISTILIYGETGTGKEVFARAIHHISLRKNKPFIAINCAAIPESLLESELFGYEDGCFTGARKGGKLGKFELANGGTIFLDEIGDMPLYLQTKLLRVLQEKEIDRLGGTRTLPVDVRIIAATHKDLKDMVKRGEFREDLYYRLNVIPISIPPLRERIEDIPLLTDYLINKYAAILGKTIKCVSKEVNEIFTSYDWPGNIRELENCIEYAVNVEKGNEITYNSLPQQFHLQRKDIYIVDDFCEKKRIKQRLHSIERAEILSTLSKYGSNSKAKEKAAAELGMGRSTFYRKLKELGID